MRIKKTFRAGKCMGCMSMSVGMRKIPDILSVCEA